MVLQYHRSSDPYGTAETQARYVEYGETGVPMIAFDGTTKAVGSYVNVNQDYNRYKDIVDPKLAAGSDVTLEAVRFLVATGRSLATTMHYSATVTNQGAVALTDVDLWFVVYEDLGQAEMHYVVRDILPTQRIASLAPGASVTLEGDSDPLTGVNTANLGGVAFVQRPADAPVNPYEILQAAEAQGPPTLQVNPAELTVSMHPNEPDTQARTFQVQNGGGGDFTWTATGDAGWLTVDPAAGAVPDEVTVTVDKGGLAMGQWYTGHVTVTASAGTYNSPQVVDVSLEIIQPGPPALVDVSLDRDLIRADGVSTATVRALVVDAEGITVTNGTSITFQTDRGHFEPVTRSALWMTTTTDGVAEVALVSSAAAGPANVVVQAGVATDTAAIRFVGPPHGMTSDANPSIIRADGTSTAQVSAQVADETGWPVLDGTAVDFATDRGVVSPEATTTVGGLAVTTLQSSVVPGQAHVTAQAGTITDTATVRFGGPPDAVQVAVAGDRLPADGTAAVAVAATVADGWGDPVVDGTVVSFGTTLGTVSPISTTTFGGVATTTLTAGVVAGWTTVTATAEGQQGGDTLFFYSDQVFLPLVLKP